MIDLDIVFAVLTVGYILLYAPGPRGLKQSRLPDLAIAERS